MTYYWQILQELQPRAYRDLRFGFDLEVFFLYRIVSFFFLKFSKSLRSFTYWFLLYLICFYMLYTSTRYTVW